VLARRADVIGDQVIVGDLVPLFGMITEVAYVLDELAGVIDQHVVKGDHPSFVEAGFAALLQSLDPFQVESLFIPDGLGQPAVQAGLIRGHGEFPVVGRDVPLLGEDQPREAFGEMPPFRLVGERRTEHVQGLFDDGGVVYNSRHHDSFFPISFASVMGIFYGIPYPNYHFQHRWFDFAEVQC
jgi:hypothetical protein